MPALGWLLVFAFGFLAGCSATRTSKDEDSKQTQTNDTGGIDTESGAENIEDTETETEGRETSIEDTASETVSAADTDSSTSLCGNGVLDTGEECEGGNPDLDDVLAVL